MISMVPYEEIPHVWPKVMPFLVEAVKLYAHRYSIEDILEQLLTQEQSLWVAYDDEIIGAVAVKIVEFPKGRVLNIDLVGGKQIEDWYKDMNDTLYRYAKDIGCNLITAYGRPGWKAMAKKQGFKTVTYIFEREVE